MKNKKTKPPIEKNECYVLVKYLDRLQEIGIKFLFTHIPLEHIPSRNPKENWGKIQVRKSMGVRKGFPDYIIAIPGKMLIIEMKRRSGSTTSPEQKERLEILSTIFGVEVQVCKGFTEAKKHIDLLLGLK